MSRLIAVLMALVIAVAASAQTTRPAATQSSADQLHEQAVVLMRAGDYKKAAPLLERAYVMLSPEQRTRPFVLNHAILDLTQRLYVMRAVRDLTAYLTKHREEDEFATNVLGAAMNIAAENPLWKKSETWKAALKEWDRRNYILDHAHPGLRRWGIKWLNDQEFSAIEAAQSDWRQRIEDQQQRLANAVSRARFLEWESQDAQRRPFYDPPALNGMNSVEHDRVAVELDAANNDVQIARARLAQLLADPIHPIWPRRFDPLDPVELSPPPAVLPDVAQMPATKPSGLFPRVLPSRGG